MKVMGADSVKVWGPGDEVPHPVGSEPGWQESVVLQWFDKDCGVGGSHRISHEPNTDGGVVWGKADILTMDGWYFKRFDRMPIRPQDRYANGFGSGYDDYRFVFDGSVCRYTLKNEHVFADLAVTDHHPPISNIPPRKGSMNEDYFPNHTEAAGRVTGIVEIKGKRYEVDGVGYRDHSWGNREWGTLKSHRWVCGILGPDYSFNAFTFHTKNGQLATMGYVICKDTMIFAREVDVVTFVEIDGFSHRGGWVRMVLGNGEAVEYNCTPICKGTANYFHETTNLDTFCTVSGGDGGAGVCVFETTTNPTCGIEPPTNLVNAVIESGLVAVEQPRYLFPRFK